MQKTVKLLIAWLALFASGTGLTRTPGILNHVFLPEMILQIVQSLAQSKVCEQRMSLQDYYFSKVPVLVGELRNAEDPIFRILEIDETIQNLKVAKGMWSLQDVLEAGVFSVISSNELDNIQALLLSAQSRFRVLR
jgi:hypothetical protein